MRKTRLIDISGERFALLTVIERAGLDNSGNALWKCNCDCGSDVVALGMSLRNGSTKSCGCVTSAKKGVPLTVDRLRALLRYDPDDGTFRWRLMRRGVPKSRGDKAGTRSPQTGYAFICVDYKMYTAHRLAWLYMTGQWPEMSIDHINGDRADNRWSNLRQVTPSQNNANSKISIKNTSGHKGVTLVRSTGRWMAQIGYKGKPMYIGTFDTIEEAAAARRKKAEWLFGEFTRG